MLLASGTGAVVAPPTGAWIETAECGALLQRSEVAPPTGAWIETLNTELRR